MKNLFVVSFFILISTFLFSQIHVEMEPNDDCLVNSNPVISENGWYLGSLGDCIGSPYNKDIWKINPGSYGTINILMEMTVCGFATIEFIECDDECWETSTPTIIPFWDLTYELDSSKFYYIILDGNEADYIIRISGDAILPVTLSSFNAAYTNGSPILSWTTQSESNNLGWNVYRSINEELEQSIQLNYNMIPGAGTSSQPTDYLFEDENGTIVGATYWYYLENVSISGETELHSPISLSIPEEENNTPELPFESVLYGNYPNPFNPLTKIQFDIGVNETGSLSIYNIIGQLIEAKQFESGQHNYSWDATRQSSGIYFYKLKTGNYEKTKRMVLLK